MRGVLRQLGAIEPEVSEEIVSGLFDWLSTRLPATISSFLAMEGEVDLTPLQGRLPGWRWVLPRVEEDRSMNFRDWDVPREVHRFGMEQPTATGPVVPIHEIDVFLVPGLGFDGEGGRIGNGAGHYDRALSAARADAVSIGICPVRRLVEVVPMEDHDVRVQYLAHETGVARVAPGG